MSDTLTAWQKSKLFHSFNIFTKLYTGLHFVGFARRSNPLPIVSFVYPFHIPLSLELCIPFSCCKFTLNFERINHKTITFSQLFHSHKNNHMMHTCMSALLVLSYWPKSQISLLFCILEISTFSCTWTLKNGTPLGEVSLPK